MNSDRTLFWLRYVSPKSPRSASTSQREYWLLRCTPTNGALVSKVIGKIGSLRWYCSRIAFFCSSVALLPPMTSAMSLVGSTRSSTNTNIDTAMRMIGRNESRRNVYRNICPRYLRRWSSTVWRYALSSHDVRLNSPYDPRPLIDPFT